MNALAHVPLPADFVDPNAPVLIQGMTGRTGRKHSQLMRGYGTNIVAGVSPSGDTTVDGVPIYRDCAQAVDATGASVSVAMVPPLAVLQAIEEAVCAGIRLIVTIAEGVPVHDAVKALEIVRGAGARWIGASTPGLAIPGRLKLGFLPDVALAPGHVGVMTKSGTLSYEICHRLAARRLGQSLWVGVGGDPVKGTRFADMLPYFAEDPQTSAILVIGEIGGSEEEELAEAIVTSRCRKPVYALIAGRTAREGITMGHAGALIQRGIGTIESKTEALTSAGATVHTRIQDLVESMSNDLNKANGERACG